MQKDQYITNTVRELLQQRGLESLGTDENLKYYINKAKDNSRGGNSYLLALNTLDMIILNEGCIAARHYGIVITPENMNVA